MKLRRPITNFNKSASTQLRSSTPSFWAFDASSSSLGAEEDARFMELKSFYSRPSGKGRFGKRAPTNAPVAVYGSVDLGGSNDGCNSNDSGIDFNSYESQFSWGSSEDAQSQFARSKSVFLSSFAQQELGKRKLNREDKPTGFAAFAQEEASLLDISGTRRLFQAKAAQIVPSFKMSPDTSDGFGNVAQNLLLNPQPGSSSSSASASPPTGGSSPSSGTNGNSSSNSTNNNTMNTSPPPSSTLSPMIPIKRPRLNILPNGGKGTSSSAGLKLRNMNSGRSIGQRLPPGTPPTLSSPLSTVSRDGRVQLQIVSQPEEQHRARYQTEGSRGAIKDRKGNGFPTVKLIGYDKPATLQIFIGTDQGKVSPHMFYQACKVTGKSSTPCIEKKTEGTIVIEIEFEPPKDMIVSCDCVGILKERNVDVEQRFPFHHAAQSRKKSTKCRMVFRTTIINSDGDEETLQLSSNPILCTQPPGHPEICKQSAYESSAKGGGEMFIIGKNFMKDTKVLFQQEDVDDHIIWESVAEPMKDYLQQNHLICVIPPYKNQAIMAPVECKLTIVSGGKQSESQRFTYLPHVLVAGGPAQHLQFGITPSPSSPASSNASSSAAASPNSMSLSLGDTMVHTTLTQSPMQMAMSSSGASLVVQNEDSMSSMRSGHMSGGSPLSSIPSSPTHGGVPVVSTMAVMPFVGDGHLHSVAQIVQERQVVSELQSILDRSVQQQEQQRMVNAIKQEEFMTTSTVPLDLQFPSSMVPVTEVSALNPAPLSFSSPLERPVVTTTQFTTAANTLNCMTPATVALLNCTTSVPQMVNPEQQLLTELLPPASTMAMTTSGGLVPSAPSTISVSPSIITSGLCQMNEAGRSVMVGGAIPTTTMTGGPLVPQVFGHNEMQVQGALANALTQMSENELMNYINPSCFEQNLSLV